MSTGTVEVWGFSVPEYLTWDELLQLPGDIPNEIELWDRKVMWNRRGPAEYQRYTGRMHDALEANARRAMTDSVHEYEKQLWQVGLMTDVFFAADKSSVLTPDFMVRRCLPPGVDTAAADVVLIGEVLSPSDTLKRRDWKMERYAEAGIPWYWEVELDPTSLDISVVRAYELVTVPSAGLAVKLLRPAMYGLVGEWEPGDIGIEISAPFDIHISWDELAF